MALQTIALENTSIKVGPARKTKHKGKMARRSKKSKRRDNYDRCESEVCFLLTLCSLNHLLFILGLETGEKNHPPTLSLLSPSSGTYR